MRRLGAALGPVLVLAGCGAEVAPRVGGTPSQRVEVVAPSGTPDAGRTPGATEPVPYPTTPLPSRSALPSAAYQRISVGRLQAPNAALRVPPAGFAQVIFACSYEEWSFQYESNIRENQNPPGRHRAGDEHGDRLDAVMASEVGRALGSPQDPLAADWMAKSYTEDAWPERRLVTAYQVKRANLTRAKVVAARNAYAKGCSVKYVPPLLAAVRVTIYAPWPWTI